jgi:MFS family permease
MRLRLGGLWKKGDFVKLWSAQTISLIGSEITYLAIPLTAVTMLKATPAQMGLLNAMAGLPALLLGLFVGLWVDQQRRRPLLIGADIGRMLLLLVIPVGALLGWLRMEHLYLLGLGLAALGFLFGVAHRSYLPSLVGRDQLVEANSKLELGGSLADIAGPAAAGGLVQALTAPIAIAADAVTFLISALFLSIIRTQEPAPPRPKGTSHFKKGIGEGLSFIFRNSLLRPLAGCIGTLSFFNSVLEALFILYVADELGLEAGLLGIIFAVGSVGAILGALVPGLLARRLGLGRAMCAGLFLIAAGDVLIPLVGKSMPPALIVSLLIAAQFFFEMGIVIFSATQVSVRQAATPDALLGRMNATVLFVSEAMIPLGSLLGGVLGEALGLRAVLLLAVGGELLSVLWLLLSPLGALRQPPLQAQ